MRALRRLLCAIVPLILISLTANSASAMLNPTLGRFLQEDRGPISQERTTRIKGKMTNTPTSYFDGLDLYVYARNNPVNMLDNSGNDTGQISVTQNIPENGPTPGMNFQARWTPPPDWATCTTKPCTKAIWVQEYSDNAGPWTTDWTQNNPGDNASLWDSSDPSSAFSGLFDQPRDRNPKPGDTAYYHAHLICIDGIDKGKTYANLFWGYRIDPNGKVDVVNQDKYP